MREINPNLRPVYSINTVQPEITTVHIPEGRYQVSIDDGQSETVVSPEGGVDYTLSKGQKMYVTVTTRDFPPNC